MRVVWEFLLEIWKAITTGNPIFYLAVFIIYAGFLAVLIYYFFRQNLISQIRKLEADLEKTRLAHERMTNLLDLEMTQNAPLKQLYGTLLEQAIRSHSQTQAETAPGSEEQ